MLPMDGNKRTILATYLPVLVEPPPDAIEYMDYAWSSLMSLLVSAPDPMLDIRQRLFSGDVNVYGGRDLCTAFSSNRYQFFHYTGETPETLIQLLNFVGLVNRRGQRLSNINRFFLFCMWLRRYTPFSSLAVMFCASTSTIHEEICGLITVLYEHLSEPIQWPSADEWGMKRGRWDGIPAAVGAIDGTSHEIQRPMNEPQGQYFSGHRHCHVIHTQIVIDTDGVFRIRIFRPFERCSAVQSNDGNWRTKSAVSPRNVYG